MQESASYDMQVKKIDQLMGMGVDLGVDEDLDMLQAEINEELKASTKLDVGLQNVHK